MEKMQRSLVEETIQTNRYTTEYATVFIKINLPNCSLGMVEERQGGYV
jgi:hypothetical protein